MKLHIFGDVRLIAHDLGTRRVYYYYILFVRSLWYGAFILVWPSVIRKHNNNNISNECAGGSKNWHIIDAMDVTSNNFIHLSITDYYSVRFIFRGSHCAIIVSTLEHGCCALFDPYS